MKTATDLRVASQITRIINLLLRILHQLLTVAGSKFITVSTAVVPSIPLGGLGPLQLQDQMIVTVALQLVQRLLSVLVPGEGDISKTSGLLHSVLLHSRQGNSVDAAVSLEQLAQIVFRDCLGKVGHTKSVLSTVGFLLAEAEVTAAAHGTASGSRSDVTVALGGSVSVGPRLGVVEESIDIVISSQTTLLLLGDEVGQGLGKSGIVSILVNRVVGVLNGNEVSGGKGHILFTNLGIAKAGKVLSLVDAQRHAGLELFDSDLSGSLNSLSFAVRSELDSLLNTIVGRLHLLDLPHVLCVDT
eukprot:Colp12_sorted_trinity150504_noHs@23807